MGVPADHFVVYAGDDVGNVERAGFAREVRMKQDLQQEIAEFLCQFFGVSRFNGIEDFVSLLDEVGPERGVSLLAVPGTATGGAEASLDSAQVFKKFADPPV